MSPSSSRSLIRRITPLFVARIRQNQRLLSSSPSALLEDQSPSLDAIHMTDNCVRVLSVCVCGALACLLVCRADKQNHTSRTVRLFKLVYETNDFK